jgi:hypothetical protein
VPYVPFDQTTKLTAGLHMNGKEWVKGSQCTYKLPTDTKTEPFRIGVVQCFYTARVHGKEQLFVAIQESYVCNSILGLSIVDTSHPRSALRIVHLDYLYSLVMFGTYWEPRTAHLKVVLHVAFAQ